MNFRISSYKIFLVPLFMSILLLGCGDAGNRQNDGLIQHPHSDPYGPKDSTMVSDDSVHHDMPMDESHPNEEMPME